MTTITSNTEPQSPRNLEKAYNNTHHQYIPLQARIALKNWLLNNAKNPYMTSSQKEQFMYMFSLTKKQITTYLINYRIRLLGRRKRDPIMFNWTQ